MLRPLRERRGGPAQDVLVIGHRGLQLGFCPQHPLGHGQAVFHPAGGALLPAHGPGGVLQALLVDGGPQLGGGEGPQGLPVRPPGT